jgi:tRNA 2-thiouridine synthesizing protein A
MKHDFIGSSGSAIGGGMDQRHPKKQLDLTGLLCPLPVLRARKVLLAMAPGEVLEVVASDPMSAIDMPHFCAEQGHVLIMQEKQASNFIFRIERK